MSRGVGLTGRCIIFCIGIALAPPCRATESARLRDGDRLAVCGDSITEQRQYTVLIEAYLRMCQTARLATTTQFGWSGETIKALRERLASDVAPFRPTVATLLYGMNDGGYRPRAAETEQSFASDLREVLRTLRANGTRIVFVGSPTYVDPERFKSWPFAHCTAEVYNRTLRALGETARAAAAEHEAVWVDVHSEMDAATRKAKAQLGESYSLSVDGVHPGANGQLVIAYAFLKAMGCSGDIGRLEVDFETGALQASRGHRVLSASARVIEIESTRYPFCFTDDPTREGSSRSILPFLPFNEELNRFCLVIRHAPARLRVAWGDEARIFTSRELAAGINLVAAFSHTPFDDAFSKTESAIRRQQEFETPAIKNVLHGLTQVAPYFPTAAPHSSALIAEVLRRDDELNEAAQGLVRPVRHRLKFEAPDTDPPR